jgi:hypothetical protein
MTTSVGNGSAAMSRPGWSLARDRTRRGTLLARRHWLLTLLLAAGLALRVMVQIAYRPALVYIDSLRYLYHAGGADPVGYRVLLQPLLLAGNLDLVAAVQHLLGLAMAVALAAVLARRGAPRWLAALAVAPVLLDGYQLQMEQTIMPDVMFETLIVAGLAALVWQPRPRAAMIVAGGLALGASATTRQVGEVLLLPALLYLAVTGAGWGGRLRQAAALAGAFALPILAYCAAAYAVTGHFRLSYTGSNEFYGRLVLATDCRELALPRYERPLCPSQREAAGLGIDGLEHNPDSPLRAYQPPPGMTWSEVVSDFNHRLLVSDPAAVAVAIGKSAMTLFALDRSANHGDTPLSRWQFQAGYPFYPTSLYTSAITPAVVARIGQQFGGGGPVAVKPLASLLRAYQLNGGYTPGPLFAGAFLAGLVGGLAALRRSATTGQRAAAQACLLLEAAGVFVLLASDAFEFTWRYQLPALITLPPAGALALTALLHRARSAAEPPAEMSPDVLEPGRRGDDDAGQRNQHHPGQPDRGGLPDKASGERSDNDGQQDSDAAGKPIGLATGHQPGENPGEGAREIGR